MLVAVVLQGGVARATHPDYEGERGFELQLTPGFGGAFTHDESVFLAPSDLPRSTPDMVRLPNDSFGASFGFEVAGGYRFTPYLSAGVAGGYQFLTPASVYTASEAAFNPYDTIQSFHVGAYARVYPMAFFNRSRGNPRVFFDSWIDLRRFDPWVSLGVSYVQFSRHRGYDLGRVDSYSDWTTGYVGVPIGIGLDYRLIPRLAVGFHLGFTPLVAGGTSVRQHVRLLAPGVDTTTDTEKSYTPAADSNTAFLVGLNVRYTFTY